MKKKMTLKRARVLAPVVALAAILMVGCAQQPAPTPAPPWLAAGCITSTDPVAPDFSYSGTPNVLGNGLGHVPSDTPCGGDVFDEGTIVRAATVGEAATLCRDRGRSGHHPGEPGGLGLHRTGGRLGVRRGLSELA